MKRNKKNNKTVNKRIIITILVILIVLGLSFSIFIYANENKKDIISNQDDKTNISDTENDLEDVISEQIILDYQKQFNNTDIILIDLFMCNSPCERLNAYLLRLPFLTFSIISCTQREHRLRARSYRWGRRSAMQPQRSC